ncbi:MAG: hypothetical protein KJ624_03955 [Chloroflexi bacterium]|nr:hypothetical protein [Chloroflexota bacterium]
MRISVLVSAIGLLLLAACIQVVPTSAPPGTPTPVTPITREQALQVALSRTGIEPEVTAVQNPRNPVARLMTIRDYFELQLGITPNYGLFEGPDMLVWVAQYEGTSYDAFPVPFPVDRTQYNYTVVVLNAQNGLPHMTWRGAAPLLPTASMMTRERAVQIALATVSLPHGEYSAAESPRNPVARLMTRQEFERRAAGGLTSMSYPYVVVWAVQVEGAFLRAFPAGPPARLPYATVAVDAQSGDIVGIYYTYAPLLG